jgi:hypothetical protein
MGGRLFACGQINPRCGLPDLPEPVLANIGRQQVHLEAHRCDSPGPAAVRRTRASRRRRAVRHLFLSKTLTFRYVPREACSQVVQNRDGKVL